jgi:hypothetical protein
MLQPEMNGTNSHFSEPQSSQGTFSPSHYFKACPEDCTIASTSSPQWTFTKNLHSSMSTIQIGKQNNKITKTTKKLPAIISPQEIYLLI